MNRFARSMALVAVALLVSECPAQKPEPRPRDREPAAQGAKRGAAGQRAAQAGQRDPAQMVARMIKEFDSDGDQKLDAKELTALLTSMRERRDGGQRMRPAGRQAGQGQAKPAQDRKGRRPDAGGAGKPGGERPKRPNVE